MAISPSCPTWPFFTASESRRSYYILPLFPFAAILTAAFWDEASAARDAGRAQSRIWSFLLVGPLLVYSGVAVLAMLYRYFLFRCKRVQEK